MNTALPAATALHAEPNARRQRFEAEALVHCDGLYRVALRFVRNAADAEDLVQDTLFRAYQAWDSYATGTNVKAWLITILRNVFINGYRRDVRRREIMDSTSAAEPKDSIRFFRDLVDDEVIHAIDALPLQYREAVVLRDMEDLHYEEIARALGLPLGTVKSRVFRARELLKVKLRNYAISTGLIRD